MHSTLPSTGTTFAVDDVAPIAHEFPQCRLHEAVRQVLEGPIESCSDYHAQVIDCVHFHPLLAAVYSAFANHRPLVLSPDHIWITIAQGIAHHMAIHGEKLRSRFVSHQGKKNLVFQCQGWADRSPENPWAEAFESWSGQIRDHVGDQAHDALVCDFSTSGPLERAVSQVVIMDVFQRYFHYIAYCICGIPTITLEGTTADWRRLADKAARLRVYDLDWWLDHLLPICDQFVRARSGDVDRKHWQNICKLQDAYGGHIINGWIAKLFPYLRAFTNGPCNRQNPIFETGEGFMSFSAPSGLSRVPFRWINGETGVQRRMEAVAGLVGVCQDPDTRALRPKVGWAVREAVKLDVLFARLEEEQQTTEAFQDETTETELPSKADLAAFFHFTNGARFQHSGSETCRIVAAEEMEPLDWGEPDEGVFVGSRGPGGRAWHRFAVLGDGTFLAVNLDLNLINAPWWDDTSMRQQKEKWSESFAPICHVSAESQGQPNKNRVVALAFTELLERLLESNGRPFWNDGQFAGYGDAEQFTRR